MRRLFFSFGDFWLHAWDVARKTARGKCSRSSLIEQAHRIGVESLTVVNLCAFFIGLVLVLQTASMLARFGAKAQVSTIITASFVREIGPVFAAIMFAGRVGTAIAAELGTMVVTEQVDAYRVFGADPVARLAVPRVLAATLMLPALTVIASVVGIFSGFLLCVFSLGVPGSLYVSGAIGSLETLDIVACIVKGATFGLAVGLIATHVGLRTSHAAEGVGEATTKTMVRAVLAILVVDLMLTRLFLIL